MLGLVNLGINSMKFMLGLVILCNTLDQIIKLIINKESSCVSIYFYLSNKC